MSSPLVYVLFLVTVVVSCHGKTESSRKPVSLITLEPEQKNFSLGQSVTVHVLTKTKRGALKKTDVYLNNTLLASGTEAEFHMVIASLEETGINTLKVVAENNDGISSSRLRNFTVLSDIRPKQYSYKLIREYDHSPDFFTQGLEYRDGFLYEGTGEHGKSALYRLDLSAGKILNRVGLDDAYFGEGITVMGDRIFQLTYKNRIGFVYNRSDFALVDSFRFLPEEGWGLTNDGKSLIMSDGTGTLTWMSPDDFSVQKKVQVADNERVFQFLNELEYDNGTLWANVWTTDRIVHIDPQKGTIIGYLDLRGILGIMDANQSAGIDVLNGIALLPSSGHLLITGKRWPKMYEIQVEF